MEGAVAVIAAGADEVSEHIVAVGGADQPVDRDPHLPGVVGGQNVAEVSCGDADVHRLVWLDLLVPQQVAVGGDIINDLGQHPAPVDGVGGGEEVPPAGQLLAERLVGKELLDSGLGIVKVAEDRADAHILPLLGDHLKLLDGGDTVLGVEDQDAGAVHIPEALQRPLPSVPGGSHQDAHRLLLLRLHQRGCKQMGQHLKGHVLESTGGAVPQLQAEGSVIQGADRGHGGSVEFFRPVGRRSELRQLLDGELVQKQLHDIDRPLLIGHLLQVRQGLARQLGQIRRGHQAAVRGQPLGDGLRCQICGVLISCADVLHFSQSFIQSNLDHQDHRAASPRYSI